MRTENSQQQGLAQFNKWKIKLSRPNAKLDETAIGLMSH